MKTDLSHLPPHKQQELKSIVSALIPRFTDIEMIILFGSYARGTYVEDKYVENGNTYEYRSDYDLLIIVNKNSQANADTFVTTLTGKLAELKLETPVHPIIHGIDFVNEALREGNYFFDDIKKEGVLLFNTSRYTLDKKRDMSSTELAQRAKADYDQWFTSATRFYEFFEVAFQKQYWNEAAFQLHQATERFYGALQLVFTGYKPKTHDIEILGWLAKAINIEFEKVFPKATLQERVRFSQLKRAYVDARYKADYKINKEDLQYLSERVQLLRTLTEKHCKQKIEGFTK